MVIAINIWSSVKYLVANADKLEILLVRLVFIPQGLHGLLIILDKPRFLVQGALVKFTNSASASMSWRIVDCWSTAGHSAAHVN